jgi:protein-L-isoaspartate(D-aspartate) O-methyltransferase
MNEYRFEEECKQMVDLIIKRNVRSADLLAAMLNVPRHLFVPEENRHWAYADSALRIGHGQTISQPYMVASMTDALDLKGGERVLDVGTGSGYQAAILSRLVKEVHTIDIVPELVEGARNLIRKLGYTNIRFHVGDGTLGLPEEAPFDAILIAAAAPKVPLPLLDQLAEEGRLIIPVGSRHMQQIEIWERRNGKLKQTVGERVIFVPLLGRFGWEK